MTAWHDDEHFWSAFGPALETPTPAEATADMAGFVDITRLPPGGRVLDVGCGHGEHSLALARLGYTVTALDFSARRLRHVSGAAEGEGLDVEILRRDMRTFSRPRHFHAILWAGASVGIFQDPGEDRRMVEQLFDALKPGGRLVVSPLAKELVARDFVHQRWQQVGTENLVMETRMVADGFAWMRSRMVRARGDKRELATAAWRLYSALELRTLLGVSGSDRVRVFGGYDRRPFDLAAARLVGVTER